MTRENYIKHVYHAIDGIHESDIKYDIRLRLYSHDYLMRQQLYERDRKIAQLNARIAQLKARSAHDRG